MERSDSTMSHGSEGEGCISNDIQDDPDIPLLNSIKKMMDDLPSLSDDSCIFRIPKRIRETNEKAYTPHVVSIGPLHRDKECSHLQAREQHKPRYLQSILRRTGKSLKDFIKEVKEWEKRARRYYAESIMLSSNDFVKIILLDGSFIIEVIWRYNYSSVERFDYLDRQVWINDLCNDMILLENQLPYFVLEGLFNLAFPPTIPDFLKLSIRFFANFGIVSDNQSFSSYGVKHFVDLVRLCHLPSSLRPPPLNTVHYVPVGNATELQEAGMKFKKHFVYLLKVCLLPSSIKPSKTVQYVPVRNATELQVAGMKFKKGLSNRMLDIQHAMEVLEIPQLILSNWTEPLRRNLMALEQFYYPGDSYIIDYIHFMDSLIGTAKDADLLIKDEIFVNYLGDSIAVASLFNNLTKEATLFRPKYYFYGMSEKINAYCKVPSHKWEAILKRDYFCTPWRAASTIAAMILLGLTVIQTICAIVSL
ncbi:UPF0481 protein At3g47200-like [Cornus florida]|uniref:UPF0481 protein At3g47200-like n=1 Tax=Cornus florida TaxID=4283 RepID=UPI00289D30CF|nr:UPF0481 protein At3g47200-like [Cornus florida]